MQTKPGRFQSRNIKIGYSFIVLIIAAGILGYLIYSQREVLINYDWDIDWTPVFVAFVVFSVLCPTRYRVKFGNSFFYESYS